MKWISVKDELPKEFETVIIAGKPYTNMGILFSVGMRFGEEWVKPDDSFDWFEFETCQTDCMGDFSNEEVTHWMPLPEPPKY
jgi:hypothetical protein